jgi:cytochrome d ubiquinol oxidase subunit I
MEPFDALLLARVQFAVTIGVHILFPTLTIGLAGWLAILEYRWMRSGDPVLGGLIAMWTKVFAIGFGMGVVSGVVLSYEFGTNWSEFSRRTGPVLGPLLSYEVLTAFFLEGSFLGIMLFGRGRVPRGMVFFATCMVAFGTMLSAFWILSANSWMHTPAGHAVRDGVFVPGDWFAIVFNPSFPYRLAHMLAAAYLTGAFVVGGVGAWYLLRGGAFAECGRIMMKSALPMIALLAPAQLVIGDLHGLNVRDHQPGKLAAIEAHWKTGPMPLILFALPDMAAERNRAELAVPGLGSLIIGHSTDAVVTGLDAFPPEDRPYVPLVFWSFRLMVGIGLFMIFAAATGVLLWMRGRLFEARWYHRLMTLGIPAGFVAVLAGWVTAEAGRQPWLVNGLMRTHEGVSPVPGGSVAASLALFSLAYIVILAAGCVYMVRVLRAGPDEASGGY